jgi:hypothetical protein
MFLAADMQLCSLAFSAADWNDAMAAPSGHRSLATNQSTISRIGVYQGFSVAVFAGCCRLGTSVCPFCHLCSRQRTSAKCKQQQQQQLQPIEQQLLFHHHTSIDRQLRPLQMAGGRAGQLPQGSRSWRPLQHAAVACMQLLGLLLLLLQAPSMVLSQAPVVSGEAASCCASNHR